MYIMLNQYQQYLKKLTDGCEQYERENSCIVFQSFFGEQYLNGYAAEMPQEEKEYRLTGLFLMKQQKQR